MFPLPVVLRLDQRFQKVVESTFDPFAQYEAVIPGKLASVMTGPENQVIRFCDDDQFLMLFSVRHVKLVARKSKRNSENQIRPAYGG